MALLDIAIIGLILISVLVGFIRGFTKELMSIAAWVISIYLAFNFYAPAATYFSQFINNELASSIVGGAAIFIGSLFILSLIGYLISKAVSASGIKGTDRVLGAVLGIVRGVLIIGFLIVIASIFNMQNRTIWQESQLINHFEPVATIINSVLPEKFKVSKVADATDAAGSIESIVPNSNFNEESSENPDPVEQTEPQPSKN